MSRGFFFGRHKWNETEILRNHRLEADLGEAEAEAGAWAGVATPLIFDVNDGSVSELGWDTKRWEKVVFSKPFKLYEKM